ncbi:hypothetical protein NDU88_003144 [Pleurodeles waltl]|uniref:Uncharacterized protein n=1 Tax=Pleurodeles waltl TaxID=8319 RepID=A0AAV7W1B1_PLEWA|nr:hypothetical protein NDU88_003144 [Pleurodeles waltl]
MMIFPAHLWVLHDGKSWTSGMREEAWNWLKGWCPVMRQQTDTTKERRLLDLALEIQRHTGVVGASKSAQVDDVRFAVLRLRQKSS